MKTLFLLCWLCPLWLNAQHSASTTKPVWTIVRNNKLLELMTVELTPKNLRLVYGKSFHVGQTSRNVYESAVHNTLLVVNTPSDKIKVFKNKYNTFLVSATLTSQRLTFGHSIRVGVTKAAFCNAFGLNPKYDGYQVIENPEGGYEIAFYFKNALLSKVTYQLSYID